MIVAFDTETCLIRPSRLAPELVCVSYQERTEALQDAGLLHWSEAYPYVKMWLDSDTMLVGHNVAYDMAVIAAQWPNLLPSIYEKYDRDQVTDTQLRQKLLDISAGCYRGKLGDGNVWNTYGYSLEELAKRCAGMRLDKDTWRLRYGEFRAHPLADWPEGAREYPKQDAVATMAVYLSQEAHKDYLEDQYRQARAYFWLHLMSAWGLRTDETGVRAFEEETKLEYENVKANLIRDGLLRPNGVRDTKKAKDHMIAVCGGEDKVRRTDKGGVCLDSDACHATGDAILEDYANLSTLSKVLSTDVPMLLAGTKYPIHSRFDLAETGRTTSSKPNIQNMRRKQGIRECFVPRPGFVFAQADYDGLELRTLAQACLTLVGKSRLAEVLNSGQDPHLALASDILHITYDEAKARRKAGDKDVDAARQTAKVANFGFPGGLGIAKLVLFAKKAYGVILTEREAYLLKNNWLRSWPEMRSYFNLVAKMVEEDGRIVQIRSNRVRGGCSYTAGCNSFFQGLGSDATKHAGWLISKACYVDRSSPLFGSRIVCYVHDEFIVETPDTPKAEEAANELARLMIQGANEWLPDVPAKTEPLLMRYWSKDAKAVVNSDGRLVPWSGMTEVA
jgi:DNA polymerase-1